MFFFFSRILVLLTITNVTFCGQSTYVFSIQGVANNYIFMADIWKPRNPIDARYIWLPIQFDKNGTPFLKWIDEWIPNSGLK